MNVETVPIVILIVIQLLNKTDRIRKGEQLSLYKSKIPNKKFSNMSWMLRLQLLKIEVLLLPFWRKWKFVSTLQLELNFSPPYRKIPQITDGTSPSHLWLLGSWELFPPPAGHLPASAGWRQQRVGAGGSPAQLELLSRSKPGGTAGREQLAREGCSQCDLSCEGRPRGRESSWWRSSTPAGCWQAVLVMSTKTKTPSIAQRRWAGGETPGESLTGAIVRTQSCPVFTILWELALKSEPPWWQGSRWTAGHLGRSTVTAVEALILPGTPLQWADTRFFYASHRGWSVQASIPPKTVPDRSPARVLLCLTLGRKSEPTAVGCWSKARQLLVIGVVYLHDS